MGRDGGRARAKSPRYRSQLADHVLHRVKARPLADEKARGSERPARKDHPAFGPVSQLYPLTVPSENHHMLAGHRSTAKRRKTDGAGLPGTGFTEAVEATDLRERLAAPLCRRLTEQQR